jgi:hypothetical protein
MTDGPGSNLNLDPQFLSHCAEHWDLNRPPDCRWCAPVVAERERQRKILETQWLAEKFAAPARRVVDDPFGNRMWLHDLADRWGLVLIQEPSGPPDVSGTRSG